MIVGIGIDTLQIYRCNDWVHYSDSSLQKIFDLSEIVYAKSVHIKSAQRFATLFAVKEAFFKALCSAYPQQLYYFFEVAPLVVVSKHPNGSPYINKERLAQYIASHQHIFLSISHTHISTHAYVMIQDNYCY